MGGGGGQGMGGRMGGMGGGGGMGGMGGMGGAMGGMGGGGGSGGGMDWGGFGKLVSGMQGAQQNTGGNASYQDLQNQCAPRTHTCCSALCLQRPADSVLEDHLPAESTGVFSRCISGRQTFQRRIAAAFGPGLRKWWMVELLLI